MLKNKTVLKRKQRDFLQMIVGIDNKITLLTNFFLNIFRHSESFVRIPRTKICKKF